MAKTLIVMDFGGGGTPSGCDGLGAIETPGILPGLYSAGPSGRGDRARPAAAA